MVLTFLQHGRIIRASGLKEKFFHLEFFRKRSDKQLVALEMNMRPPGKLSLNILSHILGGYTMDMFNYANDIDLYKEWASIIQHGHFGSAHYSRPYCCCFVGLKARFEYAHSHEEIMHRYGRDIVMQGNMPQIFSKVMGNYYYIFRTRKPEDIKPTLQFILQHKVSTL